MRAVIFRAAIAGIATSWALPSPAVADHSDHADTPPGVTLELCSDIDIDQVQEAIAIEYQDQDDRRTMVTVVCQGSTATVRVTGPSHPRGRILDIDLTGVDAVAMPRTIALLAAEMWTAPEVAAASPEPPGSAPALVAPQKIEVQWPSLRRQYTVGVGLTTVHRDIVAERFDSPQSARGSFAAWSFKANLPLFSRLGLFYRYTHSGARRLQGHEELDAPVQWRKGEGGLNVLLWRDRFRLDARLSGGNESYTPQGAMSGSIARSTVMPDYEFFSTGINIAYSIDQKTEIIAWGTTYGVLTDDQDFRSLRGSRWGAGVSFLVDEHVRLDGRAEAIMLFSGNGAFGPIYSDERLSLDLGVSYLY